MCVGEAVYLHARAGIVDPARMYVDLDAYKPVARLFANLYAPLGKPFTLVQDVTVLNTADAKKALAASPIKLSGRLEYQACDDKVCYAPTKVPVNFALTVK